jgi:hypothetical protein
LASSDRTVSPTRKRSRDPARCSPNTASSKASCCGRGSIMRRPGTGPSSRCNPANGSSASDCTAAPRSTRSAAVLAAAAPSGAAPSDTASPGAAAAAYSSSAVLPMPTSPRMTSAPLRPARASASSRSITDRSAALPCSTARTYPLTTEEQQSSTCQDQPTGGASPAPRVPATPASPKRLPTVVGGWLVSRLGLAESRGVTRKCT